MRCFSIQLVLVFLGASALVHAASPSAGAPIALLSEVELKTNSVRLSDLFPVSAPDSLRAASATIALGRAPEAGSVRRMTREEIEHALLDQPQILAAISVPADITIRRVHRQLSPAEVAAAINAALGGEDRVDPAALNLQLSPLVTADDPGLEVTAVEFDDLHQVTRFRLWTSKEPENLPFYVTISGHLLGSRGPFHTSAVPEAHALPHHEQQSPVSPHSKPADAATKVVAVKSTAQGPDIIVKAGVATRLVIEGADYRLTSTVIPLQPGALGQEIRVRDPQTHKVSSVQVAGPGLLKGSLEEKGL